MQIAQPKTRKVGNKATVKRKISAADGAEMAPVVAAADKRADRAAVGAAEPVPAAMRALALPKRHPVAVRW